MQEVNCAIFFFTSASHENISSPNGCLGEFKQIISYKIEILEYKEDYRILSS